MVAEYTAAYSCPSSIGCKHWTLKYVDYSSVTLKIGCRRGGICGD